MSRGDAWLVTNATVESEVTYGAAITTVESEGTHNTSGICSVFYTYFDSNYYLIQNFRNFHNEIELLLQLFVLVYFRIDYNIRIIFYYI